MLPQAKDAFCVSSTRGLREIAMTDQIGSATVIRRCDISTTDPSTITLAP
jgi:hypothetical protein